MHDRTLKKGGTSPFSAYRILSTTFSSGLIGMAGATTLLRRFKTPLSPIDLATLGAATHKLALLITKERVTLPLRSPFTAQADHGREGGHESSPEGHGMKRALGELLTCPHCTAPWIALGLVTGYVVAPLPTRAITTVFATVAMADMFFQVYGLLDAMRTRERQEEQRVEEERRADREPLVMQVS